MPPFRDHIRKVYVAALRKLKNTPDKDILGTIVIVWNRSSDNPTLYHCGMSNTEIIGVLERCKINVHTVEGTSLFDESG